MSGPDHFEACGRAMVRHRLAATAMVVALTLLAGLGIAARVQDGLPLDFTPQALFMDGGPQMERLREIERTFGREDNDLLLVLDAGEAGGIGTTDVLEALEALHSAMEASPRVEKVDSLLRADRLVADDGGISIEPVLGGPSPAADVAAAAEDAALQGLLISADGRIATVRVRLDREAERTADLAPIVDDLVAAARAVPLPAGTRLWTTGVPFIRTEVVSMMVGDELAFVPLVAGLFILTIWLQFRRLSVGLGPLFTVLVADVWALAVLLVGGATLNILSVLVPTLVMVVGVSDGIHLASRYLEELRIDGDQERAMGRTLRAMTVACFLTTFTTAAGFASLMVADTRVVRDFGLHSAIAVMVAFAAIMVALPCWLAWIPVERLRVTANARSVETWTTRALSAIDRLVARRPRTTLWASGAVIALALGVGSTVRSNSTLLEMYHPTHPTHQAVRLVDDHLGGVVPLFVHIEASGPDGVLEPVVLTAMDTLERELRAEPEIGWSSSIAGWIRRIHHGLTGEDSVPPTREAAAQELLLAELGGTLPLDRVLSDDRSQARILMLAGDVGGQRMLDLAGRTERRATELFADTGARVDVTGDGLMASAGVDRLVSDLLASISLVFVVILVTLWVLLRDLRLAALAALPNIVPLVFTLATLGLLGVDIQITTVVSFTVAVGLAVDDTIHFVVRYREERGRADTVTEAVSRTFSGAGAPIVATSVLLVAGFGVLATSSLSSTHFFGLLSAVTMVAALLADLFLLPALIHRFEAPLPGTIASDRLRSA